MADNETIVSSENGSNSEENDKEKNSSKNNTQTKRRNIYNKGIVACTVVHIIASISLVGILCYFLISILIKISVMYTSLGIAVACCIAILYGVQRAKKLLKEKSKKEKEAQEKEEYLYILNQIRQEPKECNYIDDLYTKIAELDGNCLVWKRVWEEMSASLDSDSKDRDFLLHLSHVYFMALKKKNDNKSEYFELKTKAARYQNIKGFLYGMYNQKTVITGIAAYVGTGALSVYASFFDDWITFSGITIAIISVIALAGFVFLRSSYYASEIELRKNGETWVRHEATIVNLEKVMMNYVMELNEFSCVGDGKSEKKLFMEQIGKVLMDNEKRFQKNMEKIQ